MEDEFINQFWSAFIFIFRLLGSITSWKKLLDPEFHAQKLFDNLTAPISSGVAPQQHKGFGSVTLFDEKRP